MVYTHVLCKGGRGVQSPIDDLRSRFMHERKDGNCLHKRQPEASINVLSTSYSEGKSQCLSNYRYCINFVGRIQVAFHGRSNAVTTLGGSKYELSCRI